MKKTTTPHILITKDQFKVMPWKNGKGTTAQIAIEPPEADFSKNDFHWRISSARIEDENQFSQFPGYDRVLTVLSGEGLLLNNQELGPFEFFEFEGEDQIHCALIHQAVEDLGVIYKRGQYQTSFQILEVEGPLGLNLQEGVHFFLPLSHQVIVDGMDVLPAQFLRVDEARQLKVTSPRYPAYVLKIQIKSHYHG